MGSPCVMCGVEAVIKRGGVWFCDIHEPPRITPSADQRDEKIALLSQEVLQLRRDLKTERRRTRREKPDEERWWDALTAAGGPGVTAKQAAFFANQALEEYHRHHGSARSVIINCALP